jgi:hypothetical protein
LLLIETSFDLNHVQLKYILAVREYNGVGVLRASIRRSHGDYVDKAPKRDITVGYLRNALVLNYKCPGQRRNVSCRLP